MTAPNSEQHEQITYEFECGGEYAVRPSRSLVFSGVLPRWIYNTLRLRVPAERDAALMNVQQLTSVAPNELLPMISDEEQLHAAVAEIVDVCRKRNLPALPAILISEEQPLEAYSAAAHPEAASREARQATWESELQRVLSSVYREIN
jgi:hypothetical protein